MQFDYHEAFKRNLGLVTEGEQRILASKRIAIAGMGGVGGSHLLTLARMGIQQFHIADMDTFELANFNRQAGAMVSNLGKPKAETMAATAHDINPNAHIEIFANGVTEENLDAFLDGVDVYVDGLDFFVLDMRARIFEKCREKGIPAVTAGPIGVTTACLLFDPNGLSFEEYFRLRGKAPLSKALHFLVGLTPHFPQKRHIVDFRYVSLKEHRGTSLSPACMACSAVMGAEVFKLLLGRGKVYYAPWATQFDLYLNRYHRVYNWRGNRNPINRLKLALVTRLLSKDSEVPVPAHATETDDLHAILDMAKWAPSGDNSQPWAITIHSATQFSLDLTCFKQNTYNLLPMPDLITTGMFLQNAAIAAQQRGLDVRWQVEGHTVQAELVAASENHTAPLYPYITERSVNRYPYRLKPLPAYVKKGVDALLDDDMEIHWFERPAQRWRIAKLLMLNSDIRLHVPETYPIHRDMIDWNAADSADRMPAACLGASLLTRVLMRWSLASSRRNDLLMRLPGSTLGVQLELDAMPAMRCSAHFVMGFKPGKTTPHDTADYLRAGAAMQRFWLYLSSQHLVMQPWYIPLMLSRYVEDQVPFTTHTAMQEKAKALHAQFTQGILSPVGMPLSHAFFTGRVGYATQTARYRSTRKPLAALIVADATANET